MPHFLLLISILSTRISAQLVTSNTTAPINATTVNSTASAIAACYQNGTACSNGLNAELLCPGTVSNQTSCSCGVVNNYTADVNTPSPTPRPQLCWV